MGVPLCIGVDTDAPAARLMVIVNAPDCTPSMVNRNVEVTPADVVLPAKARVPLPPVISTLPETDTPDGRFATEAE